MKHYGIWIKSENEWLLGEYQTIFWTTSHAVAVAQIEIEAKQINYAHNDLEVREFPEY